MLKEFYDYFLKFYSILVNETNDLDYYRNTIFNLLQLLTELHEEQSRSKEIQFCSLLDVDLFYNSDPSLLTRINLIPFLMLNTTTLIKNFEFISKELKNSIQQSVFTYDLSQIILLLNENLVFLMINYKNDLIDILSLLFQCQIKKLLNFNHQIKSIDIEKLTNIKLESFAYELKT